MSKFFLRAAMLAAVLLPDLARPAALDLETALALAVERSETARAARLGVASASEAARGAGRLPDPTLKAGVDNLPVTGPDRLHTARDSMTMKRIGISQEWLSRDKRAAREAAADAATRRADAQAAVAVAETRLQTALAYLDAYYAAETLKLTMLTEHHASEEAEAARARLASAAGSSQDVLAMTGARGIAEDESAELRQQQGAARVALERWVGLATDELAPVGIPPLPAESAFVAAHPNVVAMQREEELARRAAAVTASERRPSPTWEVSYGQRSGYSDMVSFGVTLPLPIAAAERQDRDTAAKLALADKAEADLAEAVRAAGAEYRTLAGDAERLQARVARYRTGVATPAAQRTAAATAGYRSNQASLVTVFEARHAELEAARRLLALERELAKTRARLVYRPLVAGGAP